VRSAGAIVTRGEVVDGGTAIAAPVLGPDRRPVAALTLVGPSARLDHEVLRRVMALVIETAGALSTRLLGRSAEAAEAGRR
jgi:DNA-binding IclR family transcriptional regulator